MVLITDDDKKNKIYLHPLSLSEIRLRWALLGLLGVCLFTLSSSSQLGRLPTKLCLLKTLIGIFCPFCGMTRSLIALLHNQYGDALSLHLFSPIVLISMISLFLGAIVDLLSGKSWCLLALQKLQSTGIHKLIIVLFLAYYVLRLYGLYGVGSYHDHLMNSLLGDWLLSKVEQL